MEEGHELRLTTFCRWLTQQVEGQPANTRLELDLFQRGLAFVGMDVDSDEVECIMANMIFKVRNHEGCLKCFTN